ncbi:helix-turn-helix transcriptional regulator [Bacillus sp. es.036]|uniref:helix-turn-helix transcriptional regulator n=1 Tax=Bacillus sp. es.036 TaxID=1761764 RepID=UPI000BF7287E|nr:helix-turn-helix transcriptional regulator [Bacillus sp. es.036]PFG13041.1 DNA-binding XRE family transcriptional regulator [Bacillus sp. es.036]
MRNWLINKRKKLKMTQEEVSTLSGVSRSAYSNIEVGTRDPSVETAKKIAFVLKFKWTIFFDLYCPEMKHKQTKLKEVN